MPGEGSPSAHPKPTTRGSIRRSLNVAGKALADVINNSDKAAKKGAKDSSSRRVSGDTKQAAPRASIGDLRPSSIASRRTMTPDSKTITRRRLSVAGGKLSLDEQQPPKPAEATPQGAGITRSASLRPRPGVSALPKYRPKSIVGESSRPAPSPVRAGVRRRLASSDDEKEEETNQQPKVESAAEKNLRPISPLPQRAAFKANLTSVINAASPPVKAKPPPSSPSGKGPARPNKTVKTAASSNATAPRPASSSSSSSSFTPRSPKTPGKATTGLRRSDRPQSAQSSPLRDSPQRGKGSNLNVSDTNEVGNMSHISEGNSVEDDEAEDVELLLAPVAALGAPTPAMPRMLPSRHRSRTAPQTPTRSQLPSRSNLSYLSPLPPDSDSPPSLRPQQAGTSTAGRGSILSWEQLATEASRTLGEDEIASMLSDMPAPFRPGAASPTRLVPESPCLSTFNSPGEFGSSISQVLLPDVTPSPAVHANSSARHGRDSDVYAVDAAIVTLLRLQLASAENIAKERLVQLQSMEEEIHNLKQARSHDREQLEEHVLNLEDQLCGNLEFRERTNAHITVLEGQLRTANSFHEEAIDEVVAQARQSAQAANESALKSQQAKLSALWSARVVGTHWTFVRDFAESELDAIKGDREVLAALLADLDEVQRRVCS
ncbi:hypothetical protein C8J57DRAFT_1269962 [Mycena rebaudengoi]|nr:hypothetical protein C8J57DRAFT_1269962 [Mycena rebaudengoi]